MKLNGKEQKTHIGKFESYKDEADYELDMLRGNINRMFISDDIDEIMKMYIYAKFRINLIYHYCIKMCEERIKRDAK